MAAQHCLMWCLWRERNKWSFEDTKRTMPDLKLIFFWTLLDWMSVLHSLSLCFVIDLINSCKLRDWLYGPQLYTSRILGWLYFSILITFALLVKKKKKNSQITIILFIPYKICENFMTCTMVLICINQLSCEFINLVFTVNFWHLWLHYLSS